MPSRRGLLCTETKGKGAGAESRPHLTKLPIDERGPEVVWVPRKQLSENTPANLIQGARVYPKLCSVIYVVLSLEA